MSRKILCLALICGVVLLAGCGEDDQSLSELVVGSWRCTQPELSGKMLIPSEVGSMVAEMSSTLTFYPDTRFDNVFHITATLDGDFLCSVKVITQGSYEAFDSTVVFRAKFSEEQVTPPDFAPFVGNSFAPLKAQVESMFTDTVPVSVHGATLMLEDSPWRRL